MKKIITTIAVFTSLGLYAQDNVGIGTLTPNPNAKLEIKSDDKGVLITRLTTVARNTLGTALTAAEDGMLVYDKDLTAFYYWDGPGLAWVVVGNGSGSDDQNIDNFSFDNTTNILTIQIEDGNTQTVDLTNLLNDGDADPTNEIELPATATTGQVLSWDGTNWVAQNAPSGADNWGTDVVNTTGTNISGDGTTASPLTVTDGDSDATNEIELPTGGTNGQVLSTDGSGVYTWINDNGGTDDQNIANLAFNSTTNVLTVGIEGGTSQDIDLTPLVNDADSDVTNEIQDLSINTTTNILTITNNGSATNIDLSSYLDNTDNQDLSLTGNILSLTNDATTVDLSGYMDNTDTQNISGSGLSGTTLTIGIQNGTNETVDLSSLTDADWYKVGGTTAPTNINDNIFTQGNVGIGLTNPTSKLDVNGDILYSGNTMTHFKVTSVSDDIHLDMIKASTNFANARIVFDGYGAPQDQGQIRFFTRWDVSNGGTGNLNHVMSLMETGNVGIGTPAPLAKTHIYNSAGDTELFIESDPTNTNEDDNPGIVLIQDNNLIKGSMKMLDGNNIGFLGTPIVNRTSQNALVFNTFGTGVSNANNGKIDFATLDTVRMSINAKGGYVGIGISTPSELLELQGGGIQLNNNFGIGFNGETPFDSPQTADRARIYYNNNLFGANLDGLIFEKTDGNDVDPDGGFDFVMTGSDNVKESALSIRGSGRVGVGTQFPTQELDVNGKLRVRNLPAGATNDQVLVADATGNVRKLPFKVTDTWQSIGTNSISTTNHAYTDMPNMTLNVNMAKQGDLVISWDASLYGAGGSGQWGAFQLLVDGTPVNWGHMQSQSSWEHVCTLGYISQNLAAGAHVVKIQWAVGSGTSFNNAAAATADNKKIWSRQLRAIAYYY